MLSCCSIKGSYIGRKARAVNSKIQDSSLLEENNVENCSLSTAILQKGSVGHGPKLGLL